MRWLVIALLLFMTLQAPAVAEAAAEPVPCHATEDDSAPMGQGDSKHDPAAQRAHLCPGCSIPGSPPMIARSAEISTVPLFAGRLAVLDSIARQPSVPPPRLG